MLSTLLYSSETWTTHVRHEKKLNSFHLRCLRRILCIQWQDKVPNTEVLECAGMRSMSAILSEKRLRWLSHVRRMGPGRIPSDLLYGELAEGSRLIGRPRLRYKDICKKDMKLSDINIDTWESRAEDRSAWHFVVRQGVQSQKARKPGLKTLPQRESREGRKSNCSLSWHHHHSYHHHHRSSAENAAEIAIQVLGFIATREGADRWNFIKLEATPSSPEMEGCQRIYIYILVVGRYRR